MTRVPSAKGRPPSVGDTARNLSRPEAGQLKPLNFKVPPEFHREFKTFAASHGLAMVDVLREGFEMLKERRGG